MVSATGYWAPLLTDRLFAYPVTPFVSHRFAGLSEEPPDSSFPNPPHRKKTKKDRDELISLKKIYFAISNLIYRKFFQPTYTKWKQQINNNKLGMPTYD